MKRPLSKRMLLKGLGAVTGVLPAAVLWGVEKRIKGNVESGVYKLPVANRHNLRTKTTLRGNVSLRYLRNYGVAEGVLRSYPHLVRYLSLAFTTATGMALFKALIRWFNSDENNALEFVWITALSLVTAGGVSNTEDRIRRGYVTDYFSLIKVPRHIQNLVFNISDFGIIIGVLAAFVVYCIE